MIRFDDDNDNSCIIRKDNIKKIMIGIDSNINTYSTLTIDITIDGNNDIKIIYIGDEDKLISIRE